jgi:hypothetical protein
MDFPFHLDVTLNVDVNLKTETVAMNCMKAFELNELNVTFELITTFSSKLNAKVWE